MRLLISVITAPNPQSHQTLPNVRKFPLYCLTVNSCNSTPYYNSACPALNNPYLSKNAKLKGGKGPLLRPSLSVWVRSQCCSKSTSPSASSSLWMCAINGVKCSALQPKYIQWCCSPLEWNYVDVFLLTQVNLHASSLVESQGLQSKGWNQCWSGIVFFFYTVRLSMLRSSHLFNTIRVWLFHILFVFDTIQIYLPSKNLHT